MNSFPASPEGSSNSDRSVDLKETLPEDWNTILEKYDAPGVAISDDPFEELPDDVLADLNEAYQEDPAAGAQRAIEAYRALLKRRRQAIGAAVEEISLDSGRVEMNMADRRKPPLREAATDDSEIFGRNLQLIAEYMNLTYDELTDLTGISRSTVYKIATEYSRPTLKSVLQASVAFGLHVSVLLADFQTIEGWEKAGVGGPCPHSFDEDLEETFDQMNEMLLEEESPNFDPAGWLTDVEDAASEMARYCDSPGGILGAVIGRHHGGERGAYLASSVGHKMQAASGAREVGGFEFPGRFVRMRLKQKLR